MKRLVASLLFFSSLLWANPDSLEVSGGFFRSKVGIWWPAKDRAVAPVAVWFHGGMTSGNCSKGLTAGSDLAELFPKFIVVSVSACKENHWWSENALAAVESALDSVSSRRGAKVDGVSLVGISDGTIGVLAYSVSGRRAVLRRILISGNLSIVGEAQAFALLPRVQAGSWSFLQGGADRLYSPERVVPWIELFCRNLDDCKLEFDPQGEHDWSYWKRNRLDWVRKSLEGL